MSETFFPSRPEHYPQIYAYALLGVAEKFGQLKIGYTTKKDVNKRIKEQLGAARLDYQVVLQEDAVRSDGSTFMDHDIHHYLEKKKFRRVDGERFVCEKNDVLSAILAIKHRTDNEENRIHTFPMRPEQAQAVQKTVEYFKKREQDGHKTIPRFLRNAKMRFGKTFASYQLAKAMGWTKVLVLTFKPAVEESWKDDLMLHKDFEGRQFVSKNLGTDHGQLDESRPFVCFGSFQDYLGKNSAGGVKANNERVHTINWDIVILDEYHYGAWRDSAQGIFYDEDIEDDGDKIANIAYREGIEAAESILPITTNHYLYLSGTPFRALSSGEFIEEQIFNRTYSDEQQAKESWKGDQKNNPYAMLPTMIMMTYQMPEHIKSIAQGGEFDEFDLNVFFKAEGNGDQAQFIHKSDVQNRLDLIRGGLPETALDDLKVGTKPAFPFSDVRLLELLTHTFWFLPSVASCFAMRNLLMERHNTFYHSYKVIVAAGSGAGQGVKALEPVQHAMDDPLKTKTITLSTGKLTTGVSVAPWSGVLMLRNLSTPETYFQTAFRIQTPWTINKDNGTKEILKKFCYIFDFAPTRALSQIAEYSNKLAPEESNMEKKVADFIKFLPVLAYDGSSMKRADATDILDMITSGTTATLLARRRESALLVNVDNITLSHLLSNPKAMEALMSIEGFRSLNQDLETIINKSESVKKTKQEANERDLTPKEKKELTDDEKEYKSKRKEIQKKLIKFATRIPVFMYLTDYREQSLKDVITQLEPELFKKVTGLSKYDFELLVSLGLFNSSLMNDAVWKFKSYEDASLEYIGINRHEGEKVGGYDTVITRDEFKELR